MFFSKTIQHGWVVQNTQARHAKQLEALQQRVFPALSQAELLTEQHYLKHLEIFPEGQFTVLDGERAIGMSSTMRSHFSTAPHTFMEISGNLWMGTHEADGDWLYGLDVGVDPDYRRMGIAREIYRARQEVARRLGLKGQITVGMMNGYGKLTGQLSPEVYFEKLKNGDLVDPTVSAQQRLGFSIIALMKDYLHDPTCGNCGVLMVLEAGQEI
jgi:GNAT superfamily N-acetyltransferase